MKKIENLAPPTAPSVRRQLSQRNTNRNVKEFSKFWSGGENQFHCGFWDDSAHFCLLAGGSFRPKGSCSTRRCDSVRRSNSVRRNRAQCEYGASFGVGVASLQNLKFRFKMAGNSYISFPAAEHSRRSSRAVTPVPTPYVSPRSPHNSYPQDSLTPRTPSQRSAYAPSSPSRYDAYVDDVLFDTNRVRVYESNPEQLHALQFPHETAIY